MSALSLNPFLFVFGGLKRRFIRTGTWTRAWQLTPYCIWYPTLISYRGLISSSIIMLDTPMSLILLSNWSFLCMDVQRVSFWDTFTISTFLLEHSFMVKSYGDFNWGSLGQGLGLGLGLDNTWWLVPLKWGPQYKGYLNFIWGISLVPKLSNDQFDRVLDVIEEEFLLRNCQAQVRIPKVPKSRPKGLGLTQ